MTRNKNLKEIAFVFFKLGMMAFGGPAAHIAMMEEEIVEKRKWISRDHFLDLMGATNLIPGPNSTEMTMHCGHERGGVLGLFVAGISFIIPAVVLTGILAALYVEYGALPQVAPFVMGIKPAVLAVIAGAVIKLGKKATKNYWLIGLGVLVLFASLLGVNEILALLFSGVIGATFFYFKDRKSLESPLFFPLFLLITIPQKTLTKIVDPDTLQIFWSFLKVGAILYGSGYVLFAYLDAELVAQGLLSRKELMDAIAMGQFTPGPVLSTATFIGYQLGGVSGAIAASLGIFLPSFIFVWLLNPLIPKMRKSKFLSYFLDSVNIAAVAIMLSVLVEMGKESLVNWPSIIIVLLALFFTFGPKKISTIWIILGASLLGYLLSAF
ncbi:MAG: chromate efflux transporter [Flavobacteriales bacterium]|jgi:chromate transporter|nr:chromate efflux transporter [Flavobacteriales bacterium]